MCRDVACSPAIGAACDLFVHRGRKRLVGEASNAVCCGGVVGIGWECCLSEEAGAVVAAAPIVGKDREKGT
jgi:hypothetical protein